MDEAPRPTKEIFDNALGRMVLELDPFTEGDPVGVLGSLVSIFSAYVGPSVRVKTARGTSPLTVWTVLVGVTGKGRKGTATDHARRLVEAGFNAWPETGIISGVPNTGLGFAMLLDERKGEGEFPAPVVLVQEEVDRLVGDAKKDIRLGSALREAWDGKPIVHKTSRDNIRVRDPHVAIIGHVQPKNWGAIAGSKDATGGTYNRLLPLWVTQSKSIPVFSAPDPTAEFEKVGQKLRMAGVYAREVKEVRVTPESAEWFEEITRPQVDMLTHGNEELAQLAERALPHVVRIAALYALADMRETIGPEDFDSALALVAYAVDTIRFVIPETGGESLVSKIRSHLINNPQGLARGELWDLIGHRYSKAEIDKALASLPQVKQERKASTGGRPPTIYKWDPEGTESRRERVSA